MDKDTSAAVPRPEGAATAGLRDHRYPEGTFAGLIGTPFVTAPTRAALTARLARPAVVTPRFLDAGEFALLGAVCDRLLDQDGARRIDVPGAIDARLASGETDGWRYDDLPDDGTAMKRGLAGFDQTARAMAGRGFLDLSPEDRDHVIAAVQGGHPAGEAWTALPAGHFFEDLLAAATEAYYAHPLAQEEIGYVGYADARGWQNIALDGREPREPEPVGGAALSRAPFATSDEVDAVVIGTGAGGAPLLARLAGAGLSVVALEAGRVLDPVRDFARDEEAQGFLFWNDERLSAGDDPVAFGRNNSGTGVGGSTLHYTAYMVRAQPADLRLKTDFGVAEDWPFDYDTLAPYYDEVEATIGVSGPSPYPWGPARTPYPLKPLPLNAAAQLMQRGCERLGIRTSPAANAALSGSYATDGTHFRPACHNCGFCQAGCATGAKGSADVTWLPLARAAGAEIRPECYVTGFERDAAGRITAVVYRTPQGDARQRCRAVFLCAGAIETPRLLLLNGLANASGQVGRNFMAHTGIQVWGQFDDFTRPFKGIPGGLISEDTHRPADADFAGGYLLQSIGVMPVTYASQVARGRKLWGSQLRAHMRGYNNTAGINILGDCLPYDHNYLELSDELDSRGLPKPRVHFTMGENERRMTRHADILMQRIWEAAGARDIWSFPRNAHIIGTARMGADADSSVVDPDGKAHDVPNLYISDNSTWPSALGANPALTIMALSLRTADRFLADRGA